MPDHLDKELTAAIEEAVAEPPPPAPKPTPVLRPVPVKPTSLTEQWAQKERIEQELFQRIRREKMTIIASHDANWAKIKADFEVRIDLAVSQLETERRRALQALTDDTAEKLREHELLMRRIEGSISG